MSRILTRLKATKQSKSSKELKGDSPLRERLFLREKRSDEPRDGGREERSRRGLSPFSSSSSRSSSDDQSAQINAESALGRTLFGAIPEGHQREFFFHKKNVWIWHENWTDEKGKKHELTLRYEVRPNGVFKRVNGQGTYRQIKGAELKNFRLAAHAYLDIIKKKLYY